MEYLQLPFSIVSTMENGRWCIYFAVNIQSVKFGAYDYQVQTNRTDLLHILIEKSLWFINFWAGSEFKEEIVVIEPKKEHSVHELALPSEVNIAELYE
jgi:hypothetical protein